MAVTDSRNEKAEMFFLQNFKKTLTTDLAFDHNLQIGDVKKCSWGAYAHMFPPTVLWPYFITHLFLSGELSSSREAESEA